MAWVLGFALLGCSGGSPGARDPGAVKEDGKDPLPEPPDPVPPDPGPVLDPPLSKDGWTYYGPAQGLSEDVADVSADEGGNVYVAGGDAVYAKERDDLSFLRFDAANAGITENCYALANPDDPSELDVRTHPDPPGPAILCPIVSVAGAAPGVAMIGFQGLGTDSDPDADWAQDSGGADLLEFDGKNLRRTRHVFVASPPGTICSTVTGEGHVTSCSDPGDWFWVKGRRKARTIERIAVNHDRSSGAYGDFFMGGIHASLSILINDPAARGYVDRISGQPDPKWRDAAGVWEHDHPAFWSDTRREFLTGESRAVAVNPLTGVPWTSNGFRTAYLTGGYGPDLHGAGDDWRLFSAIPPRNLYFEFWPSNAVASESYDDAVTSLSFCPDGTLWIGSSLHGLARMDPGGAVSYVSLPDFGKHGDNVYAVACDPSDSSLWIGLGWGGAMHLKDGIFTPLFEHDPSLPAFTRQPVRSIQIDAWSSPRIVYLAFMATKDATGTVTRGGGVAAYQGP